MSMSAWVVFKWLYLAWILTWTSKQLNENHHMTGIICDQLCHVCTQTEICFITLTLNNYECSLRTSSKVESKKLAFVFVSTIVITIVMKILQENYNL